MLDIVGRLLTARFIDNPVLVIGTGRSGTSVLLQALGRHPVIADLPGEAPFLTSIGYSAYLFEGHEDRDYYRDSIKVDRQYLYQQLRRLGFEVAAGPHYGLKLFVKGLLGRGTSPLGRRFWAAKTFPEETAAEGWRVLYPSVKFLYIVRNGCDVVHSMTKFGGFSQREFRRHCESWAEGVKKYQYLVAAPDAFFLRQEDLLSDPEEMFKHILKFIGLQYDPGPANFARTTLIHPLDRKTRTDVDPKIELGHRRPGYSEWTYEQKSLFVTVCGQGMGELGYEVPF